MVRISVLVFFSLESSVFSLKTSVFSNWTSGYSLRTSVLGLGLVSLWQVQCF